MAGETTKTTALTNAQAGETQPARIHNPGRGDPMDHYQFAAATSLEAADVLIMNIPVPSNAIVTEVAIYNDDMDTAACPTLALDIGVAAAHDYTDVTSSSETAHVADDIIDADLFVDGDTTAQAATTVFTALALDSATSGPDDMTKPVWERLGYDSDPGCKFNICVTSATASAALASAADFVCKVRYNVD